MSDANRSRLSIARSSAAAIPVTLSPNELQQLRTTGSPNLAAEPQSIVSQEIRSDRQIADTNLVGIQAGGDTNFELSFNTFDNLIESALLGTWVNTPEDNGTSEVTNIGSGSITVNSGTPYKEHHIVRIMDLAPGSDEGEGVYEITSISTNVLTCSPVDGNTNALNSAWAAGANTKLKVVGFTGGAAGDIDCTVSGSVMTFDMSGVENFDDVMGSGIDLVPGQWIKASGFANANNNVWGRLTAVTSTVLTIDAPAGATTQSGTNVIIWFGDYCINGTVALASHQYVVERRYEDQASVLREIFLGMAVNNFGIEFAPQAIVSGSCTFFGLDSKSDTVISNLYSGGTPTDLAAPATDVYNTSSNVGRIGRGADPVDAGAVNYVTQASMAINNNLRRQVAVGVFGASGIGVGEISITGNLTAYFDNKDLLDQVLNNTDTSFDITVVSNNKQTMTFDLPRVKFTAGAPSIAGKNTDITIGLQYQALLDATLGHTVLVQRGYYAQ